MSRPLHVLRDGGALFECPRWHDDAWYVSDIYAQRVLRIEPDGSAATVLSTPSDDRPAGLGWLPDGDLLVVINNRRQVLRIDRAGNSTRYADDSSRLGTYGNFNDMVVAADGTAFVSNMGQGNVGLRRSGVPAPTSITVIDPDGHRHDEGDDLNYPNGMVITPDGSTLVVCETGARRLTGFTIAAGGRLSEQRLWADLAAHDHWPDGCCLDADGAIWSASPRGRTGWLRVAHGGEVLDHIRTPDEFGAYACTLGGPDGRTLLLCARDHSERQPVTESATSCLFTVRVDSGRAGMP